MGNIELATQLYDEALRIVRDDNITNSSRIYIERGQIYMRMKEFDKAEFMYREAVRIDPNNAHAHFALGTFLGENREDMDLKAWPELYRAAQLNDVKIDHYFNLAIVSSRISAKLSRNPEMKIKPKIDFFNVARKSYNNVMALEQRMGDEYQDLKKRMHVMSSRNKNWNEETTRSLFAKWGNVPATMMGRRTAAVACNLAVLS